MKLKKTEKAETPGFDANQFAAEAEQRPQRKRRRNDSQRLS
ncbi:hypothetical protein [Klebsiella variicola]|nr:hypothetical protein [Klebsiella variicola]